MATDDKALDVHKNPLVAPQLSSLARMMMASGVFNDVRDLATACVRIQAGFELGIPPVQAMTSVYVMKGGKISVSAELQAARIKANPRYDMITREITDERCAIECWIDGEVVGESVFSMDDAKAAGLTSGPNAGNWKKYPRNMLFSRAVTNAKRWWFSDVFHGSQVYAPEELGRIDEDERPLETEATPVVEDQTEAVELAALATDLERAQDIGALPEWKAEAIVPPDGRMTTFHGRAWSDMVIEENKTLRSRAHAYLGATKAEELDHDARVFTERCRVMLAVREYEKAPTS